MLEIKAQAELQYLHNTSVLASTVAILVLKKETESRITYAHTHTHNKNKNKNSLRMKHVNIFIITNVYTFISWDDSVGTR